MSAKTIQLEPDMYAFIRTTYGNTEQYYVWEQSNGVVLYSERNRRIFRKVLAFPIGIGTAIAFAVISLWILSLIHSPITEINRAVLAIMFSLVITISILLLFVIPIILFGKEHICVYRTDTKIDRLFDIHQQNLFKFIYHRYVIKDQHDQVIARIQKKVLIQKNRRRWTCINVQDEMLFAVQETSLVQAILRRQLRQHTQFVVVDPMAQQHGTFTHYILDMRPDQQKMVERQLVIALALIINMEDNRAIDNVQNRLTLLPEGVPVLVDDRHAMRKVH